MAHGTLAIQPVTNKKLKSNVETLSVVPRQVAVVNVKAWLVCRDLALRPTCHQLLSQVITSGRSSFSLYLK